jgi:hypothetical protein
MAELKYCPTCKTSRECTKKGFNKDGEQLWICKVCSKKFIPEMGVPKTVVKKAPVKKTQQPVKPVVKGTTKIVVNNNTVKTVPGFLSTDEAFDMVSSYFKEIAKEKVVVSEKDDEKTIMFKVTAGGKN